MVHSLRALKAEGDNKNGAASLQQTGKLDNATAATVTPASAITPTTSDSANFNTEGFGSGRSSLGSECLFSSTDELLDFRSEFCSDSSANQQSTNYQATTCKSFSIDDSDFNSDTEKVLPFPNTTNATRYHHHHHHHHPHQHQHQHQHQDQHQHHQQRPQKQSVKARCLIWTNKHWKALEWRFNTQTPRALKMALKRHYLLVLLLCLVIVSCLLASFVISRTLDSIGSDGDNESDTSKQESTALSLNRPPVEYEQRYIDLIDLIECGKTFAFTKLRVQVRVPKLSPVYTQQRDFSQQTHNSTTAASRNRAAIENSEGEEQRDASEIKYLLTRLPKTHDLDLSQTPEPFDGTELALDSATNLAPTRADDDDESSTIDGGAISSLVRPVDQTDSTTNESLIKEQPNNNNPVLKRFKRPMRGAFKDQAELMTLERESNDSDGDPLLSAASDMRLEVQAINKTVVDCFIVDTDKRLSQKIAFEDRYRQVAVTRRVPFKRMMDTIVACRRLTWANLLANNKQQNKVAAKVVPLATSQTEPQATLVEPPRDQFTGGDLIRIEQQESLASGSAQPSSLNFIEGLFGAWLGGRDNSAGRNAQVVASGTGSDPTMSHDPQQVAEARQVASGALPPNSSGEPKRATDASYFNLGMSMVSGIVPNTLWCGLGDRAANYSELGSESQVDACCRAHDHCPIRLKPFTTDYGLVNWSMSTRSHCDCDLDFNECLSSLNSTLSNVIRVLYFRFVGLQCIDVEGKQNSQ